MRMKFICNVVVYTVAAIIRGCSFYPDNPKRSWEFEKAGEAVFYYEKELNNTFLPVVT